MDIKTLLTTDHKLPPFRSYAPQLFMALAVVLLPNLFFWAIALFLGLARPIINLDYIIPIILFALPLPWRLGKVLGLLALLATTLVDFALYAMQIFPFLDIAAIKYLASFIGIAPTRYLVMMGVALIYMLILLPMGLNWTSKKTRWQYVLGFALLVGTIGWLTRFDKYHETEGLRFARGNHYVAQSQTLLYASEVQDKFTQLIKNIPVVTPYTKERAVPHFQQPFNNKMLLIIAESWGSPRETRQAEILKNLLAQKNHFEFFEEGYFDFYGATVQAEMRELCNLNTENGYAFSKLPEKTFAACLPNQLKRLGYRTVGLHGASSQLYDRNTWYQSVGFQKSLFGEHLLNLQHCDAFNGICDSAMAQVIADEFKQSNNQKTFVYWMTLTAHVPYSRKDLRDENRFDCKALDVPEGDICNNMSLNAQLFDDIATLIAKPEMKGVEVVVVSDHMPPIMGDVPLYKNLRFNDVAWIHFKIKE